MSGQAQDLDGNGRAALGGLVPGTGYASPQLGTATGTDSVTGHLYAPTVVQLSTSTTIAQMPAIIQKAHSVSSGGVVSLTCQFTSNNAAGNSIVVVCGVGNGTAATVTDSQSNTYVKAVNGPNSTTFAAQIFYAVGIVAGANTVTVTPSASVEVGIQIYEVSGLIAQAINALDQTATGSGTGTTASTSNVAGVSPNELAFLGVGVGTTAEAVTATSGTNWTLDSSQSVGGSPSGLFSFGALSQALGSIQPVLPEATIAASKPWAAAVATFRPVVQGTEGTVAIAGYNYTNSVGAATTVIKTGAGTLHGLVVNQPIASATITIYDNTAGSGTKIGTITMPGTLLAQGPMPATYDVQFSTGLTIVTTGSGLDLTLSWK